MQKNQKKTILLVEDEKAISNALEQQLTEENFQVVPAYDGDEALLFFKNGKFDLVMLDMIIPKKDGMQVLREMRQINAAIPIIVSSNLSQHKEIEEAEKLGILGYFVKSNVSLSEIIQKITGILSDHK